MRSADHDRAFAAVKQQRNEDERVVDSDVDVDLRNADRDARSNHGGDHRKQQEVTINDAVRKRVGGIKTGRRACCDDQPHVNTDELFSKSVHPHELNVQSGESYFIPGPSSPP